MRLGTDDLDDGEFMSRSIRLAGRLRRVHAPSGDIYLKGFRRGRLFGDFDALCRLLLRPDDTVLDVGANIGLASLIAADFLPRGRIVAVEASPANCRAMARNFADHGLDLAAIEACAVGANAGTASFLENSVFGHVMTTDNMVVQEGISVAQRTIDEIVEAHALRRVDLIKLDVEGFEPEALQGATDTLRRHDPIVFLEFNSWCQIASYNRNPRRFFECLLDTFPQLYLWRDRRLVSIREMGTFRFLHDHLTANRCVDDLVASGGNPRLEGMAAQNGRMTGGFTRRIAARIGLR